ETRRRLAPEGIAPPNEHILGPYGDRAFGVAAVTETIGAGLLDPSAVVLSLWRASRRLRTKHISAIVERARSRRKTSKAHAPDLSQVRRWVAIFGRVRPWYPQPYWCVLEAVALFDFLAARGVFPTWVFGVQAKPFSAHCWLQIDGLLLNDTL